MQLTYQSGLLSHSPQRICLQGPVAYTTVGTPTVTDGVLSNCTSGSYLTIPAFNTTVETLALQLTVTMDSTLSTFRTLAEIGNLVFEFYGNNDRALRFRYLDTSGTAVFKYAGYGLVLGTPLQIRFSYASNSGTLIVKQGSTTLSTTTVTMQAPKGDVLGRFGYFWQPLTAGSVDLNDTYIYVNGKLWFGKQQARRVTCNATLVWSAP